MNSKGIGWNGIFFSFCEASSCSVMDMQVRRYRDMVLIVVFYFFLMVSPL